MDALGAYDKTKQEGITEVVQYQPTGLTQEPTGYDFQNDPNNPMHGTMQPTGMKPMTRPINEQQQRPLTPEERLELDDRTRLQLQAMGAKVPREDRVEFDIRDRESERLRASNRNPNRGLGTLKSYQFKGVHPVTKEEVYLPGPVGTYTGFGMPENDPNFEQINKIFKNVKSFKGKDPTEYQWTWVTGGKGYGTKKEDLMPLYKGIKDFNNMEYKEQTDYADVMNKWAAQYNGKLRAMDKSSWIGKKLGWETKKLVVQLQDGSVVIDEDESGNPITIQPDTKPPSGMKPLTQADVDRFMKEAGGDGAEATRRAKKAGYDTSKVR
jgi:hypothetical protein